MEVVIILTPEEFLFLDVCRVGHLSTATRIGVPHVMPVCFIAKKDKIFIAIDEKPKRDRGRNLKRLVNISENPNVAFVVDYYDDQDWSRLGWVMIRGRASILVSSSRAPNRRLAQRLLQNRYPQLASMDLGDLPVIMIKIHKVTSWGNLKVDNLN